MPGQPNLIVVGGVPGAGKSTAIRRLVRDRPDVQAIDPDELRDLFSTRLPAAVPYRAYRPLVHLMHSLRVLSAVLNGPELGGPLVVHDPATRPRRRRLFARLARSRGWRPVLVYVDVTLPAARSGQVARGRVLKAASFARHWERWVALRQQLTSAAGAAEASDWTRILVVDRPGAAPALHALVDAYRDSAAIEWVPSCPVSLLTVR